MTDESVMAFGVHKGQKLANVPAGYLVWLFDNGKAWGELKTYIEANMDVLRVQVNNDKMRRNQK